MGQVTDDLGLATGMTMPLCVRTSSSLAHHTEWLSLPGGRIRSRPTELHGGRQPRPPASLLRSGRDEQPGHRS